MPSSKFNHFSMSFIVFGITLAAFNVFHWSQPPSVLADIKPRLSRSIASVEDLSGAVKPRSEKILAFDCQNPQPLKTLETEVRIALLNCGGMNKSAKILNKQNWFQATLFTDKDVLITDYIPLVDKANTIEVGNQAPNTYQIVVYKTPHDAK